MPGHLDYALVALFAVFGPIWSYFVYWPRFLRRVAAGDPRARLRLYRQTILELWLLTAAVAVLWIVFARPLDALGLRLPGGWRLLLGLALPAAYVALLCVQIPPLVRDAGERARLRATIAPLAPVLPHRRDEWLSFAPLAVTAGICEEILFRGYLVWVLAPWVGPYPAAFASIAIFGLAHSYQGRAFAPKAFAAGAVMGILALLTGSILPGIVLHALVDLAGGYVAHLALRDPEPVATPAAA